MVIELFVSLEDGCTGYNEHLNVHSLDHLIFERMLSDSVNIKEIDRDRWVKTLFGEEGESVAMLFIECVNKINAKVKNNNSLVILEFGDDYDMTWVVMAEEDFKQFHA